MCAHAPCFIQPHHYYLVQEGQGANGTTALPPPDAVGDPNATPSTAINMSATNGKVALVATTVPLTGACPLGGNVVDLIGYGTANCSETANGLLRGSAARFSRLQRCSLMIASPHRHDKISRGLGPACIIFPAAVDNFLRLDARVLVERTVESASSCRGSPERN